LISTEKDLKSIRTKK